MFQNICTYLGPQNKDKFIIKVKPKATLLSRSGLDKFHSRLNLYDFEILTDHKPL